jgi:hypothetical protein
MTKSTAMILRGAVVSAFLFGTFVETDAQFISMNEPKRKELKSSESHLKVLLLEEEKIPLNFKITILNSAQSPVKVYLRNRNGYNYIYKKLLNSDAKILMKLDFSPLEDGEYTFVVKTENDFFIKHFNLQSGDLMTAKIGGKDMMTTNRNVVVIDE